MMQSIAYRFARGSLVTSAFVALACAQLASAQGAGDLYEVTVRMEMAGMPMQMPATAIRARSGLLERWKARTCK